MAKKNIDFGELENDLKQAHRILTARVNITETALQRQKALVFIEQAIKRLEGEHAPASK